MTCLALSGCVPDAVTRAEHAELMSSVRALRADNHQLEARLEKLEQDRVTATARSAALPKPQMGGASGAAVDALPPLTVVKLKPRRETPPRLDTAVEVMEPAEALTQELKNADTDPSDQLVADTQFERGLSMMKTGNPEAGVAVMQQFVSDWPKHPKADNALYLSGMAAMSEKDYAQAAAQFERVTLQYPAGDALLDSMLKLAECRLKMNKPLEARATWERIIAGFPGTSAASQAQARLVSSSMTPAGSP